ncbi:uncharacterized protein TM35_000701020 [Trypanosoma theileri]|uniref:Uncharacterized protein n=1 Tax=Trypanosoma theileri TaxID=67003 RepID=A0A1X0NFZ3_9TRYP|nr:uncharacterized protein TM35_000701020 [Trypanosoma theileri]ORC83438.1 hypothetical protein TM35_000701020 [Trypanosoma theileri]
MVAQKKPSDLQQEQPSIPAQENQSGPNNPEVEKLPNTDNSKPVASESIAVSGHISSRMEEDKNNTTESNEQVQGTLLQSPSQDMRGDGPKPTEDPTHNPKSVSTVDEKRNETIPSSENNIHTTSSIPENVSASAVPATLTELNKTQMGQVINQVGGFGVTGADSSIAASYQIPLLLLLLALVALASP